MILMIVGRQHCVHVFECKRIHHKRNIPQIGLHQSAATHICHLVADLHLVVAMGSLAVAAPQINGDIGVCGGLHPDPGAPQPPHRDIARRDGLVLDILVEPGTPFREGAQDPGFSRCLCYL